MLEGCEINKNIITKGDKKVIHCCERMAREIFNHPYENYTYFNEGNGILKYRKKAENGAWIPIDNCPFCGKENK